MARALHPGVLRRFVLALSLVSCFGPLQSATLERLTLDDMIAKATSIVRGRITGSFTAVQDNVVYTHYRIQVDERWKGPAQSNVEFVVHGGTAGKLRQVYSGAPNLLEGKEYLVFLWAAPKSGANYVIGFTQGLFELPKDAAGDAVAVRQASSEMMLEPGTGRVVRDGRIEMRLRDMSARISGNLAKGAKQ